MANYYGIGEDISGLFDQQANQSIGVGNVAASLADPFKNERGAYQNSLRSLMSNPGEFSTSPVYKFAYDQGLNALQRKGSVRSGNKLAELMKYGQGMASQLYFPQANLLSTLSGATTGSPAAAGMSYTSAYNRSQDQRQAGKAAGAYGAGGGMSSGGSSTPWWMDNSRYASQDAERAALAGTYGGSYSGGGGYGGGGYSGYGSSYIPVSNAGTGYVDTGYGTTTWDGGGMNYDPYGLSGYSDYGDYSGYGGGTDYADYGYYGDE